MLQRRFYTGSISTRRTTSTPLQSNDHRRHDNGQMSTRVAWTLCLAVVIVSQEDRSLLWLSFFLANFGDKIINVLSSGGVSDIPLFLHSDHWYSKVGLILIVKLSSGRCGSASVHVLSGH